MVRTLFLLMLFCFASTESFGVTYEVMYKDACRFLGYSSEHHQTDHDPHSTAAGSKTKWGVVAANFLPLWSRIKIEGFGEKIFVVEDRMNRRYKKTIDIWFPSRVDALKFGRRRLAFWRVKNVRPLPD